MTSTLLGLTALLSTLGYVAWRLLEYRELTRAEANVRLRKLLEKKK